MPVLTENQVEQQIRDYCAYRGWLAERNHVGRFVALRIAREVLEVFCQGQIGLGAALDKLARSVVQIGEEGKPDWTFHRPGRADRPAGVFYAEIKRRGKKPTPAQTAYLLRLRALGYAAEWFDSLEAFDRWYRTQGY